MTYFCTLLSLLCNIKPNLSYEQVNHQQLRRLCAVRRQRSGRVGLPPDYPGTNQQVRGSHARLPMDTHGRGTGEDGKPLRQHHRSRLPQPVAAALPVGANHRSEQLENDRELRHRENALHGDGARERRGAPQGQAQLGGQPARRDQGRGGSRDGDKGTQETGLRSQRGVPVLLPIGPPGQGHGLDGQNGFTRV